MTEHSKGLLVLKLSSHATKETLQHLTEQIAPVAESLGVEPMVLPFGLDVELKMGSEALLLRVCEALEKIAAQGEAPEVNVAEIAPQALNARTSSLNSRPKVDPSLGGLATDGCAHVSAEGTWLLEKGERVVDWSRVGRAEISQELIDKFVEDLHRG